MNSGNSSGSKNPVKLVGDLTDALKKRGVDAFKDQFPAKIAFINDLLSNELLTKDTESILPSLEELTPAVPPPLASASTAAAAAASGEGEGRRKKRKMEGTTTDAAVAPAAPPPHSDSEAESEDELLPGHGAGRGGGHYDHAHDFHVPCNKHIIRVMELLRREWKEAVEVVGAVKLGIQLSIPPIESGGASQSVVQRVVGGGAFPHLNIIID